MPVNPQSQCGEASLGQTIAPMTPNAFLFDLDGTLVDSVYQHVLAWHEALREDGIDLSIWRIHRKIGMSGGLFADQLLREIGRDVDEGMIERLRLRHAEAYRRLAVSVVPLPGAREMLAGLTDLGRLEILDNLGNLARISSFWTL